jgi:hypothetical protein
MSGYYTIHSKALRSGRPIIGQTSLWARGRNTLFLSDKIGRSFLRHRRKFLLGGPLKSFFSELCTTLSTQIVDKLPAMFHAACSGREQRSRRAPCAAAQACRGAQRAAARAAAADAAKRARTGA